MKKTIYIVFALYFFQGLIHNLGHPITPDFVRGLLIEDYMFGVFFALMSFGLALGGLFWGILGDKINKKSLMLIGLLIYSTGQYIFGNVHNVYVMSLFRFISGFGVAASATLMMSYLIEKSHLENRKKNIAYGAAMMAIGASLGYLVGGRLPNIVGDIVVVQAETVFLIQAIVNVVFAFGVYFSLEDCNTDYEVHKLTMIDHMKSIKTLDKNLIVFLFSLTLTSIAAINISKYIEVYISDIGRGSEGIGNFVFVTGLVGIFTTFVIVPQLIKLKKDNVLMILINLLSAILILIVFRMTNIVLGLYTIFMLYVILKTVYAPLETSFISSYAGVGEIGKIMGIRQFFFAMGFVIGPLVAGFIYDIKPIYVFDLSVIMFLIGFVLILLVSRNLKRDIK